MSSLVPPISDIFSARPVRTEGLNPSMLEMPITDSKTSFVQGSWQAIAATIGTAVLSFFAQNAFQFSLILSESSFLIGLGAYAITLITGFWGIDQVFQLAKRSYASFVDAFRQKEIEIKDQVIKEIRMIEKLSPHQFEHYLHRKVGLPKTVFDRDDLELLRKLNSQYPFEPLKTYLAYYLIHFRKYEDSLKNHQHQLILINKTYPEGPARDLAYHRAKSTFETDVLKKKLMTAYHLYLLIHPTETRQIGEIGTIHPLSLHKRLELRKQGQDPYFIRFDGMVITAEELEKSTVLELALLLRS